MSAYSLHQLIDEVAAIGKAVGLQTVPPEARQHFKNARREALLGIRAAVDHALASLDSPAATDTAPGEMQKITVEE